MDSKKYIWSAKDLSISQCAMCKHKRANATCAAYPGKIPDAILTNEHDHKQPFAGDNGIRFEVLSYG